MNRAHLDSLERCLSISHDSGMPSCSAELSRTGPPTSKKGRGGALSTLLEKSKVDSTQLKKRRKPPEVFNFSRCYLYSSGHMYAIDSLFLAMVYYLLQIEVEKYM